MTASPSRRFSAVHIDHTFTVPLDHDRPDAQHIQVYAREICTQARYLSHFRADAIVQDAEKICRTLIADRPWSVLGQSFGGLCTVTYLSFAPQGVAEAFITGGLPGVCATAVEVYRALYPRAATKNAEH